MKYIVETQKSIEQASEDLIQAVSDHKFGVLHIHNLKETLNNKGVEYDKECRVFEVCNPNKAKEIMDIEMSLNLVLPCRVSVYEEDGKILIGMIKPKSLLVQLSDKQSLLAVANEVETTMIKIIQQAI